MVKSKLTFLTIIALVAGVGLIFWFSQWQKADVDYQQSSQLMAPPSQIDQKLTAEKTAPPAPTTAVSDLVASAPTTVSENVLLLAQVPFTSQSPLAEWDDPRQQDGCEEASVLMVMHWVKNQPITGRQQAKEEILELVEWQKQHYSTARDTSAYDTAERLIKSYYDWPKVEVIDLVSPKQMVEVLSAGSLLIVPNNGQILGNPYFTQPGPERHMLVVIGYDPEKLEFITNDPGTRRGEGYRYPVNVLWSAIRDYPTGDHVPITGVAKVMIIVSK